MRSPRTSPRTPAYLYVDNDPLVLAHARALLISGPEGSDRGTSRPTCGSRSAILARAAEVTGPRPEPVGLILSGVMGHVAPYAEAAGRPVRAAAGRSCPAGSYLSLNDGVTGDDRPIHGGPSATTTPPAPPPSGCASPRRSRASSTACSWCRRGSSPAPGGAPGGGPPAAGPEVAVYGGVGRKP